MILAVSTHTLRELHDVLVVVGLFWLATTFLTALYGWDKGFPFFPLLVAGVFLGPIGWVFVLLAVAIGAGPRRSR